MIDLNSIPERNDEVPALRHLDFSLPAHWVRKQTEQAVALMQTQIKSLDLATVSQAEWDAACAAIIAQVEGAQR